MHALPHDPHPRRTRRAVHVAGGRRSSNAARAPRSTARRPSRRGATTPHRHPAGRTFCRTFPPFSQPARSLHIPGGSLVACFKRGKEISPTERTDERLRVSSGAGGGWVQTFPSDSWFGEVWKKQGSDRFVVLFDLSTPHLRGSFTEEGSVFLSKSLDRGSNGANNDTGDRVNKGQIDRVKCE